VVDLFFNALCDANPENFEISHLNTHYGSFHSVLRMVNTFPAVKSVYFADNDNRRSAAGIESYLI